MNAARARSACPYGDARCRCAFMSPATRVAWLAMTFVTLYGPRGGAWRN